LLIERLNAFTQLKSVDSGKLFQALITLHAKKQLLAELVQRHPDINLYCKFCWLQIAAELKI